MPRLFEELKRRNVFKVGTAYVVLAWLLAQITDVFLEPFGVPNWVIQTILILLLAGFPLALFFAWAFEMTPEGIKKESDVDRSQSITHETGQKLNLTIIFILVIALGYFAYDKFALAPERDAELVRATEDAQTDPADPASTEKSIAVLPFVNMSEDSGNEYFSDGISEEILNSLARVKELKVAGRTSSFAFKGQNQDLRQIGEALGVEHILEGSVRKSGTKVRITAQLIQVEDGFHLWSDTYDRELDDVFAIQDEIATAILVQLKSHLLEGEHIVISTPAANSEAYDLYLLAKQRIYERSRPTIEAAADLLDRAIAIDANYAPAYAQRAIATMLLSEEQYGTIPAEQSQTQAKLYLDQALRLDPQQPEALAGMGLYYTNIPGQAAQATSFLEKALAINPNMIDASNWLQTAYANAGRLAESQAILEQMAKRDPLYRPGIANLNNYYVNRMELDKAWAVVERIRPFMPNDPFLYRIEANIHYATGNVAEGLVLMEKALETQPDNGPNVQRLGNGLLETAQFERLAETGIKWQRIIALWVLGRTEEATILAWELANTGEDVSSLIGILANSDREEEAIQFFEERWSSLAEFEEDYPPLGRGNIGSLLDIAYAYGHLGNEDRFEDAMSRARTALDRITELGFKNPWLTLNEAVWYTQAGERDQALVLISKAVDDGLLTGTKLSLGWSSLKVLEGDPEFEAIQVRMFEHMNAERAELGLGAGHDMSFIEELKRRNVFRVAIAYLVSAWVMLQLADIVLESIEAPHWVIQAFMLALGLGFPIALIFAWAFEMTPEGIKKEKDVDRTQSITHKTGQKLNRSIIAVLVIAVALLLFDRFMPGPAATEVLDEAQSVSAEGVAKSIAVLPFVNMSSDTEQEYFSDGISEEILNSLARVKNLKVAGRTSSFAFKGQNQDLRAIGETLGVGHILEGSVRKSGATVRITAQLIQVEDGFHLWSDTYDRELTDVFAIQDEIATAILEQLKAHLLEDGGEVVVATTRTNSEAYDFYLLAKQRIYERMQKPLESARDLLDKAIELDPEYAPAYAQRGIATLLLAEDAYGDIPDAQAQSQAKLFLDQALRLDPELAEAWAGMGLYHGNRPAERNLEIETLEKALSLNPNLVDAGNWLHNAYNSANRPAEALVVLQDVVQRDPLYRPGFANLVFLYGQMGQLDKGVALLERTRPFMPTDPIVLISESWVETRNGHIANGLELSRAALEVQPNDRAFRVGYSVGLAETGQNQLLAEEGYRGLKVLGLRRLGLTEEASIMSMELAAEGILMPLFRTLNGNGRSAELIAYLEERWPDLQQFEEDFPSNGYRGYPEMLEIALAYRRAGHQERFNDAINRVRSAHDSLAEQGLANPRFWLFEAYYYALIEDATKTIEYLAAAIDEGSVISVRISDDFPVFSEFEGDPEYEAIQARMVEHLNTERASLGLDPVTT